MNRIDLPNGIDPPGADSKSYSTLRAADGSYEVPGAEVVDTIFARQLRGRYGLAVHEVDERYTTAAARAVARACATTAAASTAPSCSRRRRSRTGTSPSSACR